MLPLVRVEGVSKYYPRVHRPGERLRAFAALLAGRQRTERQPDQPNQVQPLEDVVESRVIRCPQGRFEVEILDQLFDVVGVETDRGLELGRRLGHPAVPGEQEAQVVADLHVVRIEVLRRTVVMECLVVASHRAEGHGEVVPRRGVTGGQHHGGVEVVDGLREPSLLGQRLAGSRRCP